MSDLLASLSSLPFVKIALLSSAYYVVIWNRRTLWLWWKGLTLPPGPPKQAFVGNKYQIPIKVPWLGYTSWSKIYGTSSCLSKTPQLILQSQHFKGPILSFELFGVNGTTVVLSSAKTASDLLDARSFKYSDRPAAWMQRLAGRGRTMFWMDTDDAQFVKYRRLLHGGLSSSATKSYRPIQVEAADVLLRGFLETPHDFVNHIRRNAVAIIMKVAYGYPVAGNDDQMLAIIEDAIRNNSPFFAPGKFLVETFPILRFVPAWFPGAGFKRLAKAIEKHMDPLQTVPYEWAIKNISSGEHIESYCSKHLEIEDGKVLNDIATQEAIKWTSSALYAGGGDTVVSALTTFILLMCNHPEVQKRAQADIDKVAPHRLPTLEDLDSLPYITAIVKEVVRWGPPVPLGLPHRVAEDDVYEGHFIPKNSTIVANIWAMNHDEESYPDPFKFDPDRHLGSDPQPDPFKTVFGYGRRFCPGAHFAQMSLCFNVMSILAVFDLLKPLNKDGVEVEVKDNWKTGVIMHLEPFECRIQPRSPDHLVYLDKA
ncbi:hypothetical protein CVT24_009146 [Panaeolus cyanescens]|uniref:Cytochrome P450 n=1 Tax=Panaeolus cyanescens TaxID=181874 RepID=A0A409WCR7_9AGAR|nr:hypothetical protein CVT24_009146 [Panaeolus cyanescens]